MTDQTNRNPAAEQAPTASFSAPEALSQPAGKKKGWLSKAFSMAVTIGAGMGVGMAIKTCALTALCTAGAPATLAAVTACAGTGFVIGMGKALWRHREAKKNGSTESFFSKKNGKSILFNTLVSAAAGSFVLAFGDEIAEVGGGIYDKISDFFNGPDTLPPAVGSDVPPPVPTPEPNLAPPVTQPQDMAPPAGPETPVAPPAPEDVAPPPVEDVIIAPTALEKAAELATDGNISALGQQTLERAQAGNAQAIKDLGYFIFNGFQGFSENQELAVDLFTQASDLGNVQAKVDLAYAAYYGFGGVDANPDAAYETMKGLAAQDGRAEDFVEAWSKIRPAAFTAAAPAP